MNRFRILHLRASNFVGGPEQQLLRYAEGERGGAYEIRLGSFVGPREGSDFLQAAEARGVQTLALPDRNFGPKSAISPLIRELKSRKIDLLCTHGFKADVLGVLSSWSAGVPVACFLRGWTRENRKVRIYEAADRRLLRFADRIVCLSESQARKLSKKNGLADKIRVVGNAIDVSDIDEARRIGSRNEVRQRYGLPQSCLLVATGGRLSPEKGISDFLEAAFSVSQQFLGVRFLVFGDGVLRQPLEHKARALGLQDRIMFVGFERDLRDLLPGVDLLVNPSHSEEMPNIVLEGMAAGIPVIATAVGGVEDIAGPERAVCLVPPGKPEILADTIGALLREPLRAKALAEAGHRRVEQTYSLKQQRSQFHALYQELLSSQSASVALNRVSDKTVAAVRLPGTQTEGSVPFLSVVMPVRNEESHIAAVLAQLEMQSYPQDRLEVLVVDGNSTDGTVRVVDKFAHQTSLGIRLLRNPAQRSSAGRNVGARNARGEYVIFIDGHCHIPSKTLLVDVVELFDKTGVDCLCRPQPLTMPGETLFQEVVGHARATVLGHGRDSTIYATELEGSVNPCSSGAMYRRNVFERVGYYDETFDACEDVEFNYRVFNAGLTSYLSSRLAVFYQPRTSLSSLWQQMIRYGRGRFRLIRKHRGAFSLSQVLPAAVLLWFVIGGIASLFSRLFAACFLVTLAIYLLIVLGFSIALGLRYGWRHLLQSPAVYFVIHFGLGAGFLAEFLAAVRGRSHRSAVSANSATLVPDSTATAGIPIRKSTPRAEGS